jgi:hypothetical protein
VNRYLLALGIFCGLFSVAEARPKQTHQAHPECNVIFPCEGVEISLRGQRVVLARRGFGSPAKTYTPLNTVSSHSTHIGPRPSRWCGWYMQSKTGVTSRSTGLNLNRAIEWARVGRPTSPAYGVIVVWRHHVGMIEGQDARGRWLVHSGNDGGQVRTRVRALSGAVAFRAL